MEKVDDFVYQNPTKIIFGREAEEAVGREASRFGGRVLLHYGGGSAEKSGLLPKVRASLREAGLAWKELGGVRPNPELELVREGIAMCKAEGTACILAVGGGSVIDSAKAIACGALTQADIWTVISKRVQEVDSLPVGCVLTIPGAGSESSKSMVITNRETQEKISYRNERIRPAFAVLNPEYTFSLSPMQTACGIVDAIGHIMERYFTRTKDVECTDGLCESVMRSLMRFAAAVQGAPENYQIRAQIMWACKIAHDGSLGTGREEDWACHAIEHELSAKYNMTHGAGLAMIYPAWMKYIYKAEPARFGRFARQVFGINESDMEEAALSAIARLEAFYRSLGLATRIREAAVVSPEELDALADSVISIGGGSVGNFVKLGREDVRSIFELAY